MTCPILKASSTRAWVFRNARVFSEATKLSFTPAAENTPFCVDTSRSIRAPKCAASLQRTSICSSCFMTSSTSSKTRCTTVHDLAMLAIVSMCSRLANCCEFGRSNDVIPEPLEKELDPLAGLRALAFSPPSMASKARPVLMTLSGTRTSWKMYPMKIFVACCSARSLARMM